MPSEPTPLPQRWICPPAAGIVQSVKVTQNSTSQKLKSCPIKLRPNPLWKTAVIFVPWPAYAESTKSLNSIVLNSIFNLRESKSDFLPQPSMRSAQSSSVALRQTIPRCLCDWIRQSTPMHQSYRKSQSGTHTLTTRSACWLVAEVLQNSTSKFLTPWREEIQHFYSQVLVVCLIHFFLFCFVFFFFFGCPSLEVEFVRNRLNR